MIEKFLEKFLPQITERLNENQEVGTALIEALAVLDNYATINNVQFTDEQVNTMLGIVPEPAPEPNADIPAEIVNIVEKKKRGRKPKATTTAQPSTWSWRFKTEQEMRDEFGDSDWRKRWGGSMRDYLFGKSIPETPQTIDFIDDVINKDLAVDVDTISFGISNPNSSATYFYFDKDNITDKPLPTAAAPTTWNWRFKTKEEFVKEYGDDWKGEAYWSSSGAMDYLFGEEIAETSNSRDVISLLQKGENYNAINTFRELGITSGGDDDWVLQMRMLTNKPLPKVILTRGKSLTAPTNTAWTWRFKTEEEFERDYGKNWRGSFWTSGDEKDYLFGQPIVETDESRKVIENNLGGNYYIEQLLGIKAPVGTDDYFGFTPEMEITQDPLPTVSQSKSKPAKRGRKPKASSNWNYRFKTEQEFIDYFSDDWRETVGWTTWKGTDSMDYLIGQIIVETPESREFIDKFETQGSQVIDTKKILGITPNDSDDTSWAITELMLTQEPLPTAAPKKRGRKPKSELPEIDLGGIEDIGDIDIDDIDFDNLVI